MVAFIVKPMSTESAQPPIVDLATWQAAREELLVREKSHTRAGDAIAAARRRLPMVEFDPTASVIGSSGAVPFLDLFEGRDELLVYKHMWWDGAPHQGQCEGCTFAAWQLRDAAYLNARGVSFAILTSGRWEEVAPYLEFMGYTQPWYSVRGMEPPVGKNMGSITSFLRDGDARVPHLLHNGARQRGIRERAGPARHDAPRSRRDVGGHA